MTEFEYPVNDLWVSEVGNAEELTQECSAFSIKGKSRGKCQSCPLDLPHDGQSPFNPHCGVYGTRTGPALQRELVPQRTLGLKELLVHCLHGNWRSVHVPCLDDGSGSATTRGANMKELWTNASSLLLDYLKSHVQIFWDKTQTLKSEISVIYLNVLSFTTPCREASIHHMWWTGRR